jgi:hypothetical protein
LKLFCQDITMDKKGVLMPDQGANTLTPNVDQAIRDAFSLGWDIAELKYRMQVALVEPVDSGLRLGSRWRASFNGISVLQSKGFPNSGTAQTTYETIQSGNIPYLYPQPPAPDYANVGISGKDASGIAILSNFSLYDVTRRAINCLTLLYVKEEESLIPNTIQDLQSCLIDAILPPTPNPVLGQGPVESNDASSDRRNRLQGAKEALTKQTINLLDALDVFLRENYYMGGVIPNNDLELVAYEAGRSLSSISWNISATVVPLEQEEVNSASGQTDIEMGKRFGEAWTKGFDERDIIRLQHQISALSAALDDAYYAQPEHQAPKPPDGDDPVTPDLNLPSQSIKAVKQSIDYWQRTVKWIQDEDAKNLDKRRKNLLPGVTSWSRPMRLALTEQANIWQTLMTGQQSLQSYNMESATRKIMMDVGEMVAQSLRTDFRSGVKEAEDAMNDMAVEVKDAIEKAGRTAVKGFDALFSSFIQFFWPILGVIALIFIVLLVLVLAGPRNINAAPAAGGVGFTGLISAFLGYIGLGKMNSLRSEQQTAIQNSKTDAQATTDEKARTAKERLTPTVSGANFLTRVEGAAEEASTWIDKALTRGYKQIRVELDGLNRSIAVAYPLVEFFGLSFDLEADEDFITEIIWNGAERQVQIKEVLSAAFGPIAVLIASPELKTTSDGKNLPNINTQVTNVKQP